MPRPDVIVYVYLDSAWSIWQPQAAFPTSALAATHTSSQLAATLHGGSCADRNGRDQRESEVSKTSRSPVATLRSAAFLSAAFSVWAPLLSTWHAICPGDAGGHSREMVMSPALSSPREAGVKPRPAYRVRGKNGTRDNEWVQDEKQEELKLQKELAAAKARMKKHLKLQDWLKKKEEKELAAIEQDAQVIRSRYVCISCDCPAEIRKLRAETSGAGIYSTRCFVSVAAYGVSSAAGSSSFSSAHSTHVIHCYFNGILE